MTGIVLDEEIERAWTEMRMGHKYRYLILTFSDDISKVILEKTGDSSKTYDDFVADLPPLDVRYAVVDFDFASDEGIPRNKLVFVTWAPAKSPVKRRMLVAGTKITVRSALDGVAIELQATDASEIAESEMLAKCKRESS